MARWMSGRAVLHLRRVGVAGKPVGVAVRWYVHRPGFGVQGHLPPTAYLRGRAGNNMHRECHITPVAGGPAAGVPTRGGGGSIGPTVGRWRVLTRRAQQVGAALTHPSR